MTYDNWKSTNPQDSEPHWTTCPVCKIKHYEHEDCLTPEPELDAESTRNEALDAFFEAVRQAIPETVDNWCEVRFQVREAGLRYCHVAVQETITRMLKAYNK